MTRENSEISIRRKDASETELVVSDCDENHEPLASLVWRMFRLQKIVHFEASSYQEDARLIAQCASQPEVHFWTEALRKTRWRVEQPAIIIIIIRLQISTRPCPSQNPNEIQL
jgi:hypothetical protein